MKKVIILAVAISLVSIYFFGIMNYSAYTGDVWTAQSDLQDLRDAILWREAFTGANISSLSQLTQNAKDTEGNVLPPIIKIHSSRISKTGEIIDPWGVPYSFNEKTREIAIQGYKKNTFSYTLWSFFTHPKANFTIHLDAAQ